APHPPPIAVLNSGEFSLSPCLVAQNPENFMLGWFHAIMPKEEKFFDLFARHSQAVVAGAEALRAMLDGGDAVPRHYRTLLDREQDADNVTREVLIAVRRTFITPFARGDIQALIPPLDTP